MTEHCSLIVRNIGFLDSVFFWLVGAAVFYFSSTPCRVGDGGFNVIVWRIYSDISLWAQPEDMFCFLLDIRCGSERWKIQTQLWLWTIESLSSLNPSAVECMRESLICKAIRGAHVWSARRCQGVRVSLLLPWHWWNFSGNHLKGIARLESGDWIVCSQCASSTVHLHPVDCTQRSESEFRPFQQKYDSWMNACKWLKAENIRQIMIKMQITKINYWADSWTMPNRWRCGLRRFIYRESRSKYNDDKNV